MLQCLEADVAERPVLSTYTAVLNFLRAFLAFDVREKVAALFLDGANNLLAAELIATGTVDQVAIYPREVCRRALEIGAVAIILGHNHPAGSVEPSDADRALTRCLVQATGPLGITVHDHIIVSRTGWRSMKQMGVL